MAYHPGVGVFKFDDCRSHILKLSVILDYKLKIYIDAFGDFVYNLDRTLVRVCGLGGKNYGT